MQGLAQAISMPHEYAPQRFPSFPALERTAVMGFNAPLTWNPIASSCKALLCRQAAYPLWLEYTRTQQGGAVAQAFGWPLNNAYGVVTAGDRNSYTVHAGSLYAKSGVVSTGNPMIPTISGAISPPAEHPVAGLDDKTGNGYYMYAPKGSKMYVIFNSNTTVATNQLLVRVGFEYWKGPGEVSIDQGELGITVLVGKNNAMATATNFADNTWTRITSVTLNSASAQIGTASISIVIVTGGTATHLPSALNDCGDVTVTQDLSTNGFLWPATVSPEFSITTIPWTSTRTTAVAALFTNVTKVLNKEGTVLVGRVNPNVKNPFTCLSNDVTGLHPAEKAQLALETGLYTYCPPTTDMVFFADYTSNAPNTYSGVNDATIVPIYRLDNDSFVNVGFFNDPDSGTALSINLDWHIEFRTSSTLFQIGLSTITLDSFHTAQLALVSAGFFFENFDHKALLQKVIGGLARFTRFITPGITAIHPIAGRIAQVGSDYILSNKPAPAAKASSAAGSGIVRKTAGVRRKKAKVAPSNKRKGKK